MAVPSPVSICNLALDVVPAATITSLDDNNHRAEVCSRHYPQALGEMMELEWTFATKRAVLAQITNVRPKRWKYAFAVPNDLGVALRARRSDINTVGWGDGVTLGYDLEDGTLWSDYEVTELEYITNDPAMRALTPSFIRALYYTLAAKICMPISKSESRTQNLFQTAELWRDRALAADLNKNALANRYGDFIPEVIAQHLIGAAPYYSEDIGIVPPAYTGL